MSRVLMVGEGSRADAITASLGTKGFEIYAVSTVPEAVSQLQKEGIDVVISELTEELGLSLLRHTEKAGWGVPAILTSGNSSGDSCEEAERMGAVRILHEPFSDEELSTAVEHAADCGEGFHGRVHGMSLVDLFQVFHYARRSVAVQIGCSGWVHFYEGEVINASLGEYTGEDALREILLLKGGSMATLPVRNVEVTISRGFQSLLLDMLREVDESEREPKVGPSAGQEEDPFGFGSLLDSLPPEKRISTIPETTRCPTVPPVRGLLDGACQQLIERVEQTLAAAVVELSTGVVLGLYSTVGLEFSQGCVAVAQSLFGSSALSELDASLNPADTSPQLSDGEFRAVGATTLQFFRRISGGRIVLVLVADRKANPGLCAAELRRSATTVERATT